MNVKRLFLVSALSALGTIVLVNYFQVFQPRTSSQHAHTQMQYTSGDATNGYHGRYSPRGDPRYLHFLRGSALVAGAGSNIGTPYRRGPYVQEHIAEKNGFFQYPVNFRGEENGAYLPPHQLQYYLKSVERVGSEKLSYFGLETGPLGTAWQLGDNKHMFESTTRGTGREIEQGCSFDAHSCGDGAYCCNGMCRAARTARVEFAADGKGELWMCKKRVRKTDKHTQTATYDGPVPCGIDLYVKAISSSLQSGAAIGVLVDNGPTYGSGSTLSSTSQTNSRGSFEATANYTQLAGIYPYNALIATYGAHPVKDAYNSRAEITNFKFKVC